MSDHGGLVLVLVLKLAGAAAMWPGRRGGELHNDSRWNWNFSTCTLPPVLWGRARFRCRSL